MLNGRGFSYERNNVDIVLTEKEAAAVANSVELDLCGYLGPEAEAPVSYTHLDVYKRQMTDRAMQTLYKFSLEPIAETYAAVSYTHLDGSLPAFA